MLGGPIVVRTIYFWNVRGSYCSSRFVSFKPVFAEIQAIKLRSLETFAFRVLLVIYFIALSVSQPYSVTATPTCLFFSFSVIEYVAVILSSEAQVQSISINCLWLSDARAAALCLSCQSRMIQTSDHVNLSTTAVHLHSSSCTQTEWRFPFRRR